MLLNIAAPSQKGGKLAEMNLTPKQIKKKKKKEAREKKAAEKRKASKRDITTTVLCRCYVIPCCCFSFLQLLSIFAFWRAGFYLRTRNEMVHRYELFLPDPATNQFFNTEGHMLKKQPVVHENMYYHVPRFLDLYFTFGLN